MASSDTETVPKYVHRYPKVESVSKVEFVRDLEAVAEDGAGYARC